jgi:hypothetical protein
MADKSVAAALNRLLKQHIFQQLINSQMVSRIYPAPQLANYKNAAERHTSAEYQNNTR